MFQTNSEAKEEESDESGGEQHQQQIVISDQEANEIYLRMQAQSLTRKGYIKKNWAEEETKLLKWAVQTYLKQKNINSNNLVKILKVFDIYRAWQIGKIFRVQFREEMTINATTSGNQSTNSNLKRCHGPSKKTHF